MPLLRVYMERHIDVDGNDHGPKAKQLLESLCGKDPNRWTEVVQVAWQCTRARIQLWNAVMDKIKLIRANKKPSGPVNKGLNNEGGNKAKPGKLSGH